MSRASESRRLSSRLELARVAATVSASPGSSRLATPFRRFIVAATSFSVCWTSGEISRTVVLTSVSVPCTRARVRCVSWRTACTSFERLDATSLIASRGEPLRVDAIVSPASSTGAPGRIESGNTSRTSAAEEIWLAG